MGVVAERVIGTTACAAHNWMDGEKRALLCNGVVVCGWASGSSVNKYTFLYIGYLALYVDIRNCKRYRRLTVVSSEGLRLLPLGDAKTSYTDS